MKEFISPNSILRKKKLGKVIRKLSCVSNKLLLMDYDGTLAPFRIKRESAYPYREIKSILKKIIAANNTHTVIISARGAKEVLKLLNFAPAPEIYGSYGLEKITPNGDYIIDKSKMEAVKQLSDAFKKTVPDEYCEYIEYKKSGLAVHFRGICSEAKEEFLGALASNFLKKFKNREHFKLIKFNGGTEILLAFLDKSKIINQILEEYSGDFLAVYLGDDFSDEEAFKTIKNRGFGILISKHWRKTNADFWLVPPVEVRWFLEEWLQSKEN